MKNKDELDQYAAEMVRRFEALTTWAIENWPHHDFPLMQSDFAESRREIAKIVGPKLGEGDPNAPSSPPDDQDGQYIDMNPAPWP